MTVAEHVERYLGRMDQGWAVSDPAGVQVALFRDRPQPGVNAFVTLGLSRHVLQMPKGDIREELLCCAGSEFSADRIAQFLGSLGDHVALTHRALLRGSVVGPGNPIIPDLPMRYVYVSAPTVLPDSFEQFDESVPATVFPWVIPIYDYEADFVRTNGWSSFEDLLEAREPDLYDLARVCLV